jgi:hypothetical protein
VVSDDETGVTEVETVPNYDEARSVIFSQVGNKLREETYTWESMNGLVVLIVSMHMGERSSYQKLLRPSGAKGPTAPTDKAYFELLRRTVRDRVSRRPLFTDNDFEAFQRLDPEKIEELVDKVLRVCGLHKDAVAEEKED